MTTIATSRSADPSDAMSTLDSVRILSYTVTARMTHVLPSNVPMMTADSRTAMSGATTSATHDDDPTSGVGDATAHRSAVAFSVELQSTAVVAAIVVNDDVDWTAKNVKPSADIVVATVNSTLPCYVWSDVYVQTDPGRKQLPLSRRHRYSSSSAGAVER